MLRAADRQLLVYGGAAVLVFLLSALLPLLFRKAPEEVLSPLNRSERAALFSAYWNGGDESIKEPLTPSAETETRCRERMRQLTDICFQDEQDWTVESEGSEYFTLSGEGGEARLCRSWLQCQGDWRNWLDVCFDAESGELYYLYVSSACVTNAAHYRGQAPDDVGPALIADWLAGQSGDELLYFDWSGDPAEAATALYTFSGGALRYRISCIFYDATLVDIKINCDM